MAGSISLSLSQQFDSTGAPLNGGFLYFYAAGTTTPQSAYQDVALTIPWPNPIVLDSAGRIPAFYLADGQIKIRLTDSNLVTQVSADNLLVVGASSGTASPPSVDATTVFTTGDIKTRYDTASITGWVRYNGRTIGSATSGGTERANADCESLFVFLWNLDGSLSVSTGRGATAAADWAANKNIALPDFRGRVSAGFDDMGSTAASRLTSTGGMTGTGIGSTGGAQTRTLAANQIPAGVPSSGTNTINVASSNFIIEQGTATVQSAVGGGTQITFPSGAGASAVHAASSGSNSISVTSTNAGQVALITVQPSIFVTVYGKL